MHPSHKTRFSDSSAYDEVCVNCGVTDAAWDTDRARDRCPGPELMDKRSMNKPIISFSGEYGFLSNFSPHPVLYNGYLYKTVEHAFQANKSVIKEEHNAIQNSPSPGQAKRLGRKCTLRPNWDNIKDQLMEDILRAKFTTNPDLKTKLLATGDRQLIEGNDWGDRYWGAVFSGVTMEWSGENKLGKILMKLREEFR